MAKHVSHFYLISCVFFNLSFVTSNSTRLKKCLPNESYTIPSIGVVPQLFSTLISTLKAAECAIEPMDMWPKDFGEQFKSNSRFDFIVVGSGAGGSVVASRLSENPKWTVLLVEAGGDPPIESQLPPLYTKICNTEFDWNDKGRTSYACLNSGGKCNVCHGKVLGGSTSINGLFYSRGNKQNYDEWAIEYGNRGWSYDEVLPYFKKSEGNLNKSLDPKYHNFNGPLKVSHLQEIDASYQVFVDAALEQNATINPDFNGASEMGLGSMQFMAANGRRQSAMIAFINPVKNRPNLFIMKHSTVTKVLINESKRAYGVKMSHKGRSEWTALATKEVIVSAGVVGSPHLLLLSGIGPTQQLTKFGIPTKQNLPVGNNVMDHFHTLLFFKAENITNPKKTDDLDAIYQLAVHNTGKYTRNLALLSYLNTKFGQNYPNYEAIYFLLGKGQPDLRAFLKSFGYNETVMKPVFDINKDNDILAIYVALLTPESRGSIALSSSNPCHKPIINLNYLAEPNDLNIIVDAVQQQQLLGNTKAFRAKGAQLIRIPLPQCDCFKYLSSDYWKCYVRVISGAGYHHCCSNKMGPSFDRTAVVDAELRVHGIHNLRVIDASIFPYIPSAHTTAPTLMVAEKGSDLIKATWTHK